MEKCPICSGSNLVLGRLTADLGGVGFLSKETKKTSSIIALACKDCGNIVSIKVEKREKL